MDGEILAFCPIKNKRSKPGKVYAAELINTVQVGDANPAPNSAARSFFNKAVLT